MCTHLVHGKAIDWPKGAARRSCDSWPAEVVNSIVCATTGVGFADCLLSCRWSTIVSVYQCVSGNFRVHSHGREVLAVAAERPRPFHPHLIAGCTTVNHHGETDYHERLRCLISSRRGRLTGHTAEPTALEERSEDPTVREPGRHGTAGEVRVVGNCPLPSTCPGSPGFQDFGW